MILSKDQRSKVVTRLQRGERIGTIALKVAGVTKAAIKALEREINGATEETKRKLKDDPLLTLYREKKIEMDELYAAEYIRRAHHIITSDVQGKTMSFEGYVDLFGGRHVDETNVEIVIQKQYSSWIRACVEKRISHGAAKELLTEPSTFESVDTALGYASGWSKGQLEKSLKLYVELFKSKKGRSNDTK